MKKGNIMVGTLSIILSLVLIPAIASALSIGGYQGNTLTAGGYKYFDTGAELLRLTDTDGYKDDSTVFLMLELAGFANSNHLGIYDALNNNRLEVFAGTDSPLTAVTLAFDLAAGTVTNTATNTVAYIGKTFGFYISTPQNQTYYTEKIKNADGVDHFRVFNTSDNRAGELLGSDIVLGIEDLWGGGDRDYDDMVVGATDLAPVPEPGTLLLLGSGLIGVTIYARRRKQA